MAIDLPFLAHFLNALLMIVLPIGLGIFLTRRFRLGWRLWWLGAATFIASQVLHIPFNTWVLAPAEQNWIIPALPAAWKTPVLALLAGLSAGVFEELARYIMYRWPAKDARSWRKGILAGAGHGGIEAVILGGLTLYAFFQFVALRGADLTKIIPPEQLDLATQQVQTYWSAPWTLSLLGAVERVFALCLHIACSLLVLQAFTRRNKAWLLLAILYHAAADAVTVAGTQYLQDPVQVEGLVGLFGLLSLVIIFALRQPEPAETPLPAAAQPSPPAGDGSGSEEIPARLPLAEETREDLDKTRYN